MVLYELRLLIFFVQKIEIKLLVMKKALFILILFMAASTSLLNAQTYLDSTINSATKRIMFSDGFNMGSYGEAHYNQEFVEGTFQNGKADLHRIILFMGYKFNDRLQFFTEIEFEHVNELAVEQAYIDYSFESWLNFKAGAILIPMGYVNEFHEPTLFNGVERSAIDSYVIPSTWRELGFGFHGIIKRANLKYQAYMVNGFNGYDGSARISAAKGLRSARQHGSNAILRRPAFAGKLTFYGLNGLRVGLSGYHGNSESTLYDGIDRNDALAVATADSSSVGISMVAFNAHYNYKNLHLMAVGNLTSMSNTDAYNAFTGAQIGSQIMGYYGEVAYHIGVKKGQEYPKMVPFVRYENYNTHHAVGRDLTANEALNKEILTGGLSLQPTPGTTFKIDYQWIKNIANPKPTGMLNLGFGYWF
jgi:hypothetical protein